MLEPSEVTMTAQMVAFLAMMLAFIVLTIVAILLIGSFRDMTSAFDAQAATSASMAKSFDQLVRYMSLTSEPVRLATGPALPPDTPHTNDGDVDANG